MNFLETSDRIILYTGGRCVICEHRIRTNTCACFVCVHAHVYYVCACCVLCCVLRNTVDRRQRTW